MVRKVASNGLGSVLVRETCYGPVRKSLVFHDFLRCIPVMTETSPHIAIQVGKYMDGLPMWFMNMFLAHIRSQNCASKSEIGLRRYLHRDIADVQDGEYSRELLTFQAKVFFEAPQSCCTEAQRFLKR